MMKTRKGGGEACRIRSTRKSQVIRADSCLHQIVHERESRHFDDGVLTVLQGVWVAPSSLFFVEAVSSLMRMCQVQTVRPPQVCPFVSSWRFMGEMI